jgi:calcineurin-like phosphoesterase family protein
MLKNWWAFVVASLLILVLAGISLCVLWRSHRRSQFRRRSPQQPQIVKLNPGEWRFIVSGDSRNCGDVIMPAIAADSRRYAPTFYWHLGDLRAIYKIDEDMEAASANNGLILTCDDYHRRAWPDFISNQIAPFAEMPFFVGVGNHETIPPKDENQFLAQFSGWLTTSVLIEQRKADGDKDPNLPKPYYHWINQGVDFIYLDNASGGFSREQLNWFDSVIARAQNNPSVLTLVLGMHEALPDSISSDHAMCDDPKKTEGCTSGRHVYQALLNLQNRKPVYVLASHSHFYMNGTFNNHPPNERLPGWIIGTAGAVRYALPKDSPADSATDVYGYLVGTVEKDGKINFEFQKLGEEDVPEHVRQRYPSWFVPWCFAHNSQHLDPMAEETTHRCPANDEIK